MENKLRPNLFHEISSINVHVYPYTHAFYCKKDIYKNACYKDAKASEKAKYKQIENIKYKTKI